MWRVDGEVGDTMTLISIGIANAIVAFLFGIIKIGKSLGNSGQVDATKCSGVNNISLNGNQSVTFTPCKFKCGCTP